MNISNTNNNYHISHITQLLSSPQKKCWLFPGRREERIESRSVSLGHWVTCVPLMRPLMLDMKGLLIPPPPPETWSDLTEVITNRLSTVDCRCVFLVLVGTPKISLDNEVCDRILRLKAPVGLTDVRKTWKTERSDRLHELTCHPKQQYAHDTSTTNNNNSNNINSSRSNCSSNTRYGRTIMSCWRMATQLKERQKTCRDKLA